MALIAGLISRGIKREMAEKKVTELFPREEEEKAADRVYTKLMEKILLESSRSNANDRDRDRKFLTRLNRFGFSHSTMRRLLERYREEIGSKGDF